MYRVEIDQSGRVEKAGDTIIAFANEISEAAKISFKVAQAGLEILKSKSIPPKLRAPMLWSACVFLVLEPHLERLMREASLIILDNEFDGHQAVIKASLLRFMRRKFPNFPTNRIRVDSIGKKSPAHKKALTVKRRKAKPDRFIQAKQLKALLE